MPGKKKTKSAKRYKPDEVKRMKRAYMRTQSYAMAAKVVGCHPTTIRRFAKRLGWTEPIDRNALKGRETTLTADIAVRLAIGWRENIGDETLAALVGVSHGQLRWWLENNTQVTIVRRVHKLGPDGKPLTDANGNEVVERRAEEIGLHDLRVKARAELEFDYLAKHARAIERALAAGDLRTAMHGIEWRLTVHNRPKYAGTAPVQVNVSQQLQNLVNIEELNLPLEVRKQILFEIRRRRAAEADPRGKGARHAGE